MILVQLWVPDLRVDVEVHASFCITHEDGEWPWRIDGLDLIGPDSAVKAVVSALLLGSEVKVHLPGRPVTALRLREGTQYRGSARSGDLVHALFLHPDVLDSTAWEEDPDQALFRVLCRLSPVPLLREWMPWLRSALEREGDLKERGIYGRFPSPSWRVSLSPWRIESLVRRGLEEGELCVPGAVAKGGAGGASNGRLALVESLDDYLLAFGPALAARVVAACPSLHQAQDPLDPRLQDLVRRPFPAQAHVAQGVCKALRRRRSAFLVGEMGCGKSLIAAATAHLLSRGPYRVLVMCPGHMVRKWKREVELTVPGAVVTIIESWRAALACFRRDLRPQGAEFYVVSKETAKLSHFWRPAALWRDGRGVRKLGRGWHCPACGRLLVDRNGVPWPESVFSSSRKKSNKACPSCGGSVWQADGSRVRRVAVVDIVKRLPRNYFDLFIADEMQDCAPRGAAS